MKLIKRIAGVIIILTAVIGMILSIAGIVGAWQAKPAIKSNLSSSIELTTSGLKTTVEGLTVAEGSLEMSMSSVDVLKDTVKTTATTISDTAPTLDNMTVLLTQELPATLRSAQQSLETAQQSAKIIDSVLTIITAIPLISKEPYNPDVPLSEALGKFADSLEGIPTSLENMEDGLNSASDSLVVFEEQISLISENISEINASLSGAVKVLDQYKTLISGIQTSIEKFGATIPAWVDRVVWLITLILVWAMVVQIGLLFEGWDLLDIGEIKKKKDETGELSAS